MSRHRFLACAAAAALLVPAAASSAAQPGNKTRATRAVRSEVKDRYNGFDVTYVGCTTLTSRRFKCEYVGLSSACDGLPARGTARATVYAGAVDVTLNRYRCDY